MNKLLKFTKHQYLFQRFYKFKILQVIHHQREIRRRFDWRGMTSWHVVFYNFKTESGQFDSSSAELVNCICFTSRGPLLTPVWSSSLLVLSLPALCLWYWRQGLRSNLNSGDVQIICNNLICKIALFHQLIHLHVIRAEQKIARNKLNGKVHLLLLLLYLCLYLTARVCELRSDILLIWQVTSFSLDVDWEFKPGYLIQNNNVSALVFFTFIMLL